MKTHRLFFLGFGTIGRALLQLLLEKQGELEDAYGVRFQLVAVASRRHGMALDSGGLDGSDILRRTESGGTIGQRSFKENTLEEYLRESRAEIFLENTPTDRQRGEPAATHVRAALRTRLHVVTANKGPAAFAYRELCDLARLQDRRFLFEATVMDGTPVFSLCREALPAAQVKGFRAILNSTTNYLLTRIEEGMDFEEAVQAAQTVGIAETDPMADVDGWDATLKTAILVNVLMDFPLRPEEITRGDRGPGSAGRPPGARGGPAV
jgi:homoserine dehydrogenase